MRQLAPAVLISVFAACVHARTAEAIRSDCRSWIGYGDQAAYQRCVDASGPVQEQVARNEPGSSVGEPAIAAAEAEMASEAAHQEGLSAALEGLAPNEMPGAEAAFNLGYSTGVGDGQTARDCEIATDQALGCESVLPLLLQLWSEGGESGPAPNLQPCQEPQCSSAYPGPHFFENRIRIQRMGVGSWVSAYQLGYIQAFKSRVGNTEVMALALKKGCLAHAMLDFKQRSGGLSREWSRRVIEECERNAQKGVAAYLRELSRGPAR
ncbi:MAG TPA: hypothetical protein VMB50_04775 [Myxococcales bacterium]|nr:hypothetical protein [Myxococcales bacterium]